MDPQPTAAVLFSQPGNGVWKRTVLLAVLALPIVVHGEAYGHGLVMYPSTPVSPPAGYLWIAAVWAAVLIAANALFIRRRQLDKWHGAIATSLLIALTFALLFVAVGFVATILTNGFLPGPWWGYEPFYGLGWSVPVLFVFCFWNAVGWLLLRGVVASQVVRTYRLLYPDKRLAFRINAAIYLGGLVPFMLTGALAHGWAGGHLDIGCRSHLAELGQALLDFAGEHDNRLPPGTNMQDVFVDIRPYLGSRSTRDVAPVYVCPVCAAFELHPKPYLWNAQLAGRSIEELRNLDAPVPVITCACGPHSRYHQGCVLTTENILRAVTVDERDSGALWPTANAAR